MSGTDGDVGHSIAVVSPSYITNTGDHSHCIMIMFGIYNTKVVCKMTDTEDRIPASRQFHHLSPVSAVSRDEERTGVYLSFFPEVRSRVDTHVIVLVVL